MKTVYQEILSDFFPRYIKALTRTDYTNFISKIRIEGHSSTEWTADTPSKIAYINNMDLSQRRASAVLRYVLDKVNIDTEYDWMKGHLLAVGYSSSENVLTSEGDEDREASRRVEFKVVMSAQEELFKIINGELPKDFERWNMSDEEKEEFRELFKTQKSVLKLRKAKN